MFRPHARSDCRPGPVRPTAHRGPLRSGSGPRTRKGSSASMAGYLSCATTWRGSSRSRRWLPEFAGIQSWRHPFPLQHSQDGAGGTLEVHSDPPEAGASFPHAPHRLHLVGPELPGGPRTFRLSHRDPGIAVERHPAAPLAGMGKSIASCQGEINRVSQPPPELRQGEFPAGAVNRAVSSQGGRTPRPRCRPCGPAVPYWRSTLAG